MAGGAALFFYLAPPKAVLADINSHLMNFYRALRDDTSLLIEKLESLSASRRTYYSMRKRRPTSRLDEAVRFAYLNRLCWNGLHRVNQEGDFNVPMGDRLPTDLWDPDSLRRAAKLLHKAELLTADFETGLAFLSKNDFAFVDPPYPRGASKGLGFNRYTSDFFSIEDHKRLGATLRTLDRRGVFLMITLGCHPEILKLYPRFNRTRLRSKSLISCESGSRGLADEVVLTNYTIEHVGSMPCFERCRRRA
jgi:DNA adenine methylase